MITDSEELLPEQPPPSTLGERGRALWLAMTAEVHYRPDELPILEAACAEVDLIHYMEQDWIAAGRPMTTFGSRNQLVAHPALGELRQHRSTLRQLLGQLDVPEVDDDDGDDPAPGVRRPMSRQASARLAARARWGNRGSAA